MENKDQKPIVSAILIVGVLIAGAILLRGAPQPAAVAPGGTAVATAAPAAVTSQDRTLGNPNAKVTLIMYEDFQCPFCGAVTGLELTSPSMKPVMDYLKKSDPAWAPFMPDVMQYVNSGSVLLVYRDFAFLGPESIRSAEAARCAGDQGKFWQYHDYLYAHQNGENQGAFSDPNLKSFAKSLGLNTADFNKCLDSGKYTQAIADSKNEASNAGVTGTPKGFILRNGKIFATIDGAESLSTVKPKIDAVLK